jgi:DNA polymerase-3 subunit gamma/tau
MSYQVLARKYRPQTFEEIVGQGHVATTLTNALVHQTVAHAYLFSGPRGVGKTTTARILAKALNCAKGPTATPCNACDSCLRIAQGQELIDVLEIDAASNRGIEEIRELRENVRYAPARSRYKVYIVDEAHQITHDAFNAFLKTLEEPPEHAVFVLATTEHQKIPATILSRCQMFRFKRVSAEEIANHLEKILKSEKVKAEPEALARLARAAGGSVRDALSLLDQSLAYASGALTAKQVEMLLGFLPDEFLIGFASALLERKPAGVLDWVRQLVEEGWDIPQFVRDFREFLRQTMVDQLSAEGSGPRAESERSGSSPRASGLGTRPLTIAGRSVSLSEVLQMIKVMGQCVDEMRWNDNPRLILELYSLRLTQPFVDAGELLRRLEQLEKTTGEPEIRRVKPEEAGDARKTGEIKPLTVAPKPYIAASPVVSDSPAVSVSPAASASPVVPVSTDVASLWKRMISELWKKPSVASHLERAHLKSATDKEWLIGFVDAFAMESVQRNQAFLDETVTAVVGHPIKVRLVQQPLDRREGEEATVVILPVAEEKARAAVQDVRVQKVLDVFKGKVRE